MLLLKSGHEVSYKTFWELNFGFAMFFSSFGHNPSVYDVWHFCNFCEKGYHIIWLNLHWGLEFSFQIFFISYSQKSVNFICLMAYRSSEYSNSNYSKIAFDLSTELWTGLYIPLLWLCIERNSKQLQSSKFVWTTITITGRMYSAIIYCKSDFLADVSPQSVIVMCTLELKSKKVPSLPVSTLSEKSLPMVFLWSNYMHKKSVFISDGLFSCISVFQR